VSVLDDWADAVCRELGLTDVDSRSTVAPVLDLARDVAHQVARPAAPLTAFLLGVAVGRSAGPEALARLAGRLEALAAGWPPAAGGGGGSATDSDKNATLRGAPTVERPDQEP
jgi:Domain of unknown function (DUF6457)